MLFTFFKIIFKCLLNFFFNGMKLKEKKCEIIRNLGKTLVCLNLKFQMILQVKTLRVLSLTHCCPCIPMIVSLFLFLVFAFHLYMSWKINCNKSFLKVSQRSLKNMFKSFQKFQKKSMKNMFGIVFKFSRKILKEYPWKFPEIS